MSDKKESLLPGGCMLITTYTMVSYSGKKSEQTEEVMNAIHGREWGLMLMDKVHVVPAKMFQHAV
eukprot:13217216-Ditylum_brightwellii.AAC.1